MVALLVTDSSRSRPSACPCCLRPSSPATWRRSERAADRARPGQAGRVAPVVRGPLRLGAAGRAGGRGLPLPASRRARAGAHRGPSYGHAGAIELLWPDGDPPPVVSAHNTWFFWSRDVLAQAPFDVAIGLGRPRHWPTPTRRSRRGDGLRLRLLHRLARPHAPLRGPTSPRHASGAPGRVGAARHFE